MIEYLLPFTAGLISFLSPCVLPLIPGYISYISGSSLNELIESQKNTNDQTIPDEEVYEIISEQIEKREEMIIQEEELVDDLLSVTESGILPESITNGHTQALVQEKSLEKSIEEYEKSLESDENLSEEAKIQIRNALSETRSNFNEEREKRRERRVYRVFIINLPTATKRQGRWRVRGGTKNRSRSKILSRSNELNGSNELSGSSRRVSDFRRYEGEYYSPR